MARFARRQRLRRPPRSGTAPACAPSLVERSRRRYSRLLQAVDDGHGRRAVHAACAGRARSARCPGWSPTSHSTRDLLLRQVEVGEGLGEVAVDRAMGQADVEARRCCVISPMSSSPSTCGEVLAMRHPLSLWHRPVGTIVSVAYNAARKESDAHGPVSRHAQLSPASTRPRGSRPTSPTCSTRARSRRSSTAPSTASSPTRSSRRAWATTSPSTATA